MKMTTLMGISAAAALGLATSLPVAAATTDPSISISIDKTYTIDVTQKRVDITNSSEADSQKTDTNGSNTMTDGGGNSNTASIDTGSFGGANGVIGVNQSPGSMNNQGNSTSIAMTKAGDAIVNGNSSASESNTGNSYDASFGATPTDTIDGSFDSTTGVVGVNQGSGYMNNQNNGVALSLGTDSVAALSTSDLSLSNSGGIVGVTGATNSDTLTNSFTGTAAGVMSVNQSSGSLNNQANTVSIAATGFPAP